MLLRRQLRAELLLLLWAGLMVRWVGLLRVGVLLRPLLVQLLWV